MPTKLSEKAVEGSTFVINVEFYEKLKDGTLNPFVPNSGLNWSLMNEDGTVVNNKIDEPLDPPAQSMDIVLFGNDLALPDNHPTRRYVTVKGTYNSIAGNNLPIREEVSFQIVNIVGVS